jgi:tetratricopeptide (TPR) repeat protein
MLALAKRLGKEGRLAEALPQLVTASASDPEDMELSLAIAALQAWFGQGKEYAATRARILAFARGAQQWNVAERAAKACSILSATGKADLDAALTLGRTAVQLDRNGWTLLALGMAEYRSGNDAAAQEALLAAVEADPNNLRITSISAFYQAMSLFRQGKKVDASKLALAAASKMTPLPKDEQNPFANNAHHDYLIMWLAYKEAKAMLKFDVP